MLAQSARVSRATFPGYLKTGKRIKSQHLTIVYHPATTFAGGVVVSKKVAKRAVERNSLRRSLYGQLYRAKNALPSGVYITLVQPSFAKLTKAERLLEYRSLIERCQKGT